MTYVIEAIAIGYALNLLYQFTMGLVRLFNHPCTDTQKEQEDVLPSNLDRLDVEETTGLNEPTYCMVWSLITDHEEPIGPEPIDYALFEQLFNMTLVRKELELYAYSCISNRTVYDVPMSGLELSTVRKGRSAWALA